MTTNVKCSFEGCLCDNYREELNGPHIVSQGNCMNCDHPVNFHPQKPIPQQGLGIPSIFPYVFIFVMPLIYQCSLRSHTLFSFFLCSSTLHFFYIIIVVYYLLIVLSYYITSSALYPSFEVYSFYYSTVHFIKSFHLACTNLLPPTFFLYTINTPTSIFVRLTFDIFPTL